jgi:menaquinol-cytochrome c reductase cytochrome b/c subunit
MAEVPEHLLQRSRERRKALGLDVPGEAGGEAAAHETEGAGAAAAAEAADAPAAAETAPAESSEIAAAGGAEPAAAAGTSKIPAHLLERSKKRKEGATAGAAAGGGGGAVATAAAATAVAAPPSTATGPGGHTQRLLTVVKAGSIQQTKADPVDKVHVWPHLLVMEFTAMLLLMALLTVFSAIVRAPLLEFANFNQTPNPSKAPWYFLGLQELLTMFHPMVAGVTIPGVALGLLAVAPFIDKTVSNKPSDRKFAICIFTLFMMFWAILVIIGSFFRGEGFNFVFPWESGLFFDL